MPSDDRERSFENALARHLRASGAAGDPAHYIAVSKCVKGALKDAGVDPETITVIYDGVPVDCWPKTDDRSRVLAVDLEDPGKGKKLIEGNEQRRSC